MSVCTLQWEMYSPGQALLDSVQTICVNMCQYPTDPSPGTDGLFDNVYPEEILSIVSTAKDEGWDATKTATRLAKYARRRAADEKYISPFAYGALSRESVRPLRSTTDHRRLRFAIDSKNT